MLRGKRRSLLLKSYLEERWLPTIEATVRPSTFASYRGHVTRHILPALGDSRLADLKPTEINELYGGMLIAHAGRRALSPSTVKRVHATLHRSMRDAVKWGLLEVNPVTAADPPRSRANGSKMKIWKASEVHRFLAGIRNDDDEALWVLLSCTGMRRGEALGLRWADVDVARKTAAIRQTVVWVSGEVILSSPKTARGIRVVALDGTTVRALKRRRSAHMKPSHLIFGGSQPFDPTAVSRRFRELTRELGLPRIRLHDLRHTHASLALQAGVHPKIVSERLGHSTIAITLDIYSHVGTSLQAAAAKQIEELVQRS